MLCEYFTFYNQLYALHKIGYVKYFTNDSCKLTINFPNLGLVRNVTFTCDVTVVYVKGGIHGVCFSTVSVCLQ